MTFMAEEIADCPDAAKRLLDLPHIEASARELRRRPFSFVVVVRATLVASLVTSTVAPGTTAPSLSVTRPSITPVA